MNAKVFLKEHFEQSNKHAYGPVDKTYVDSVIDAWMDDRCNSKQRFEELHNYLPNAKRVLDMASGCGTFVFYGLINGYDVYGIDPEKWKHELNELKAAEYGYPHNWLKHFTLGVGEYLPFPDDFFEAVCTYQTIEHVQVPRKVIAEMLRVTHSEGGIFINFPDYRGTFEPHYQLPWLPLFPKTAARFYLKLLKRPTDGLDNLQYVTKTRVEKWLKETSRELDKNIKIIDLNEEYFNKAMRRKGLPIIPGSYFAYRAMSMFKNMFTHGMNVNLLVKVVSK